MFFFFESGRVRGDGYKKPKLYGFGSTPEREGSRALHKKNKEPGEGWGIVILRSPQRKD